MTRVLVATEANVRQEVPNLANAPVSSLRFVLAHFRATSYAVTISVRDFPILLFKVREPEIVKVLAHEENHRALMAIGEPEAARALDHPDVHAIVDGVHVNSLYRLVYSMHQGIRNGASPKTEAR